MLEMIGREYKSNVGKKLTVIVLSGTLVLGAWAGPAANVFASAAGTPTSAISQANAAPQLTLLQESIVSSGVRKQTYRWSRMKNNNAVYSTVNVVVADLQNPYVKLDVMTGQQNQFTKRANVLNMTRETGAIAGINGDYFNMNAEGAPLGPQISSGELMATPTLQLSGMYSFGITKENKPIIETFTFSGTVRAANGQTYPLSGMNRTYGWFGTEHSHGHAIHLYTSAWGSKSRANDGATNPTEVLVIDGVVTQIVDNGTIDAFVPDNGVILRAAGKGAEFIAANVKTGDRIETRTSLAPVNPNLKYTENDFKMLIGGHTMLLIDGKPAAFTRDVASISGHSNTSRSGVGFSQDGRYVYLVAADHAGGSVGPTLSEFQQILIQLGVWRAVNLDGGGSTTLASRPLGEFQTQLDNTPKDGAQRRVVNGIGVYTTAPAAALQGFILSGPKLLWKGETASYSVKAYDKFYNPLDPSGLPMQFKSGSENLTVTADGQATGAARGTGSVVAVSGPVSEKLQVEVADREAIGQLEVAASKSPASWTVGDTIKLQVKATLLDGRKGTIPPDLVQWQFFGINGIIAGDQFTFSGLKDGVKDAMLVARYDRFSTRLPVPVPQEVPITDFTNPPWMISSETYPAAAVGSVELTGDANRSLALAYDFTGGDGTVNLASYATFNGTAGIPLANRPKGLKLNVFGDGQGGWLRAEFANETGEGVLLTLADSIDWQGWKNVSVDLQEINAKTLKRIYVVSKMQIKGKIGIDDIAALYPDQQPGGTTVQLTVGKKDVTVEGMAQTLDQPPIIERERTFVPVRFIVDALGGHVDWNAEEKKVTVRKDGHFIELWIDDATLLADGSRVTSDVAPMIRGGRTMLPLRFITERLGLNVVWNPETRTVTIQ